MTWRNGCISTRQPQRGRRRPKPSTWCTRDTPVMAWRAPLARSRPRHRKCWNSTAPPSPRWPLDRHRCGRGADGGPPPVILPPSGGSFLVLVADDEKKQTTRERTPQRPALTEPSEPDVDSPPQRLSSAERKSLARHSLAVARPPSDLFASPAPTYSEPMKLRSASRKEKAGGESREASRTREERMEALRSRTASRKQRATATAAASSSSTSSPPAVAAGSSSDIRSGGEPSPSVVTEAAAPSSVAAARAMFERKAAAPSEAAPPPSRKSVAKEPIMRV